MRNKSIDGMKAIAILGVVFYHLKILTYGYLGVDIFFVIAGYFTARSTQKSLESRTYKYIIFITDRLKRLMPLVVIGGLVCLIIGYAGMLPDDFENLSTTIVASNLMANNVLAAITTKNYWDVANDYKPLMHLWYVGVLFQFYFLYFLASLIHNKKLKREEFKDFKQILGKEIVCLTLISFILYLLPQFSTAQKFYFLPFRFYEFGIGMIYFYVEDKVKIFRNEVWSKLFCALILVFLCWNFRMIPDSTRLVIVVILTILFLASVSINESIIGKGVLAKIGKRSYSIFIWHQILLAFYRYYFSNKNGILFIILYLGTVLLVSEVSYRLIELKSYKYAGKKVIVGGISLWALSTGLSLVVFFHAGVVRDVPELGVYMNNVHRGMHKEYCDRIYSYDHDFMNNGRIKVFVTGWSFARDFANILLESEWGDYIDLSYAPTYTEDYNDRIREADYVFVWGNKNNYLDDLFDISDGAYWGIGPKNFGESNGIIYKNRFLQNYFEQVVEIDDSFMVENEDDKKQWGNNYIDMIRLIQIDDGVIPVFTDDNMFISQDCRHLTEAGARYYATLVDWDTIFRKRYNN